MKKVTNLPILFFVLAASLLSWSQTPGRGTLSDTETFTVPGSGAAQAVFAGYTQHFATVSQLTTTSITGCNFQVDSSVDGVTWVAGGIIGSTACNSNTVVTGPAANVFSFARVTVTTISTGKVAITYISGGPLSHASGSGSLPTGTRGEVLANNGGGANYGTTVTFGIDTSILFDASMDLRIADCLTLLASGGICDASKDTGSFAGAVSKSVNGITLKLPATLTMAANATITLTGNFNIVTSGLGTEFSTIDNSLQTASGGALVMIGNYNTVSNLNLNTATTGPRLRGTGGNTLPGMSASGIEIRGNNNSIKQVSIYNQGNQGLLLTNPFNDRIVDVNVKWSNNQGINDNCSTASTTCGNDVFENIHVQDAAALEASGNGEVNIAVTGAGSTNTHTIFHNPFVDNAKQGQAVSYPCSDIYNGVPQGHVFISVNNGSTAVTWVSGLVFLNDGTWAANSYYLAAAANQTALLSPGTAVGIASVTDNHDLVLSANWPNASIVNGPAEIFAAPSANTTGCSEGIQFVSGPIQAEVAEPHLTNIADEGITCPNIGCNIHGGVIDAAGMACNGCGAIIASAQIGAGAVVVGGHSIHGVVIHNDYSSGTPNRNDSAATYNPNGSMSYCVWNNFAGSTAATGMSNISIGGGSSCMVTGGTGGINSGYKFSNSGSAGPVTIQNILVDGFTIDSNVGTPFSLSYTNTTGRVQFGINAVAGTYTLPGLNDLVQFDTYGQPQGDSGINSSAIINPSVTAIYSGPLDSSGHPLLLSASGTSTVTVTVSGGATPILYTVNGVGQTINSNITSSFSPGASDVEVFVFMLQDTTRVNPVNGDVQITSCIPIIASTSPIACASASGANPQYWYSRGAHTWETNTSAVTASWAVSPVIMFGVLAANSSSGSLGIISMPFNLTPEVQYSEFGHGGSLNQAAGYAPVSLTFTDGGAHTLNGLFNYAACFLSGSGTVVQHSTPAGATNTTGFLAECQTPALIVNSAIIKVDGDGKTGANGAAAACANGPISGFGGAGGGSGGNNLAAAGCSGGSHNNWMSWGVAFGAGSAGTAGSPGTAGGAGAASNAGLSANGTAPLSDRYLSYYAAGIGAPGAAGAGVAGGGSGGNGGSGGGVAIIKAPSFFLAASSAFTCAGTNGGTGATSTSSGGCGGGGGGGTCGRISYFSANGNTGISAAGGSGNTSCTGLTPASTNGGNGGGGNVIDLDL